MKHFAKQYAQALAEVLETTSPADQEKVLDNFVNALAENNDLRMFDDIAAEFHKLELEKKGIKQVEITSVHPLSRENEKAVIEELNRLVKSDIEVKKKIDENLIGGVVVRMDDKVLDASIKNQLQQLKHDLNK